MSKAATFFLRLSRGGQRPAETVEEAPMPPPEPPVPPKVYYPDAPYVEDGILCVMKHNGGMKSFDLAEVEVLDFTEVKTKDDRTYFICTMTILGRDHTVNTPSIDSISRAWRELHRH